MVLRIASSAATWLLRSLIAPSFFRVSSRCSSRLSSIAALLSRACSSSRPSCSLAARCSFTPASRAKNFSRCCPTSACRSALFRISIPTLSRADSSSVSAVARRSEVCRISVDMDFLRSSSSASWLSRSRASFTSSSRQRFADSFWMSWREALTAASRCCSSWSSFSSEDLASMSDSLSPCAFSSVLLSCSRYWRWESRRPSASVTWFCRFWSSLSSSATRKPTPCTLESASLFAFSAACSISAMLCFVSWSSFSNLSFAEVVCSRRVSFSSRLLRLIFSACARDSCSASSACCIFSTSWRWAMLLRSASCFASPRSFLRRSRSCCRLEDLSSASARRSRRPAPWLRIDSCIRACCAWLSLWSSSRASSRVSRRRRASEASLAASTAASTSACAFRCMTTISVSSSLLLSSALEASALAPLALSRASASMASSCSERSSRILADISSETCSSCLSLLYRAWFASISSARCPSRRPSSPAAFWLALFRASSWRFLSA
mmetsp:Transcript_28584/g.85053  ORF Transcript_28584/g.85053 Transcript_28584/m.85053 type:complete len:496 (+) Transcript_28584:1135-2622(+)